MNFNSILGAAVFSFVGLSFLDLTKFLIFVLICLIVYLIKASPRTSIPGPFALPIVGNLPLMMNMVPTKKADFLTALSRKYGDIFRVYFGHHMIVFVSGYETLHTTFVKKSDVYTDRPIWLPEMAERKGGLTFRNGDFWKTLRRFTIQTFRDLGVGKLTIEDMIQDEMECISDIFEKSKGKPMNDIRTITTAASCNILHHVIFGFRLPYDDKTFMRVVACIIGIFQSPGVFFFGAVMPTWLQSLIPSVKKRMALQVELDNYINERIKENAKQFDSQNIKNYVEAYINQEGTSDVFLRQCMADVIVELLVAGTDSSATTLDWAILYMIAFPEVQEKCFEEIEQVIGSGRRIQAGDRPRLVYIEATLLEIQRFASVAAENVPHMASEDAILNGHHVPKGAIIVGVLKSVHYDEKLWKDPHKFNPDRFIDKDGKICNREYVIPFGMGPRICLGESLARMELFLLFSGLVQRFKFTKVNPDDELSLKGISGISVHAPPYQLRTVSRC